jgi:hypothetical protein
MQFNIEFLTEENMEALSNSSVDILIFIDFSPVSSKGIIIENSQ